MSENQLFIINAPVVHEIKIKRSLFIGAIAPVERKSAAEQFLDEIRQQHYNATHNCYAYRIDQQIFRYSDDGEPSGTAGKPILLSIDKFSLIKAALVVTRYYGGVKLGTGGLMRAYGQCAEETIQKCKLEKFVRYHFITLQYPYNLTRQIHYIVGKFQGQLDEQTFDTSITSVIKIPSDRQQALTQALLGAGDGNIQILATKEKCT